jgi:rod shape-determining protein MreC
MSRSFKIGSSQRRSPVLVTALVIAAILLVALDQAGMLGDARARATTLLAPALQVIHQLGAGASDALAKAATPGQADAELAALRDENSRLKAENLRAQQLEQEVIRLRQQLRIEEEQPWNLLGAAVSSYGPDAGRRQILLAVGSDQGVAVGMAVIAREGSSPPSLIGVVEEVGPGSARVLLITDFSSAVSGRVYRVDYTIDGVVQGQWQRGSRLRLEDVARDAIIAAGDVVVTAGLSASFGVDLPHAAIPPNIPIGTIEQVQTASHSQQAEIRPFVDPDRIRYAWVILDADG